MKNSVNLHSNKDEYPGFLRGALMWRGSVTPRILTGLLLISCYPLLIVMLDYYWLPLLHMEVTPFEYTGVVLGLVLVFRTNAGHERWWEARKIWGGINNQSRNLVIGALNYGPQESVWREEMLKWTVTFSSAVKESLRNASKIAALLEKARFMHQMDGFTFQILEGQRILLVDYIDDCERILKTPMPLVYAIKTRRFILIFLLLLPFSLIEKAGFSTVFVFFWLLIHYCLWIELVLSYKIHSIQKI
jgi:putative membrane protein